MSAFIQYLVVTLSIIFASIPIRTCDGKRPFYIIAHQVNKINEIEEKLQEGANVLETDITFHNNGSVEKAYHPYPCTGLFDPCTKDANLENYLQFVRNITDPDIPDSYADKMVMQFFDLKLSNSENKTISGAEMAQHVLDHLWSNGSREQEIRVLIHVQVDEVDAIKGFVEEFNSRGEQERLKKYVGFDGGTEELEDIKKMFEELDIQNIWQGNGIAGPIRFMRNYDRMEQALKTRDSDDGYPKKIYDWTLDSMGDMNKTLETGVDGMIVDNVGFIYSLITETDYSNNYTLATPSDDPFVKYEG